MAQLYNMDIVKVTGVACDESTPNVQSVSIKSKINGREYKEPITIISADVDLNTEIQLRSSTSSYGNLDNINIIKKDKDGNVVSEKSFNRTENGTYKENPKTNREKQAPYRLTRDTTYSM